MDWDGITVRIDWTRCTRRRWPPKPRLAFTPQERRKERNVLLYWWAGRGQRKLLSGMVPIHAGLCHWSRPGWTYECIQSVRNPLGVTAIHFDLHDLGSTSALAAQAGYTRSHFSRLFKAHAGLSPQQYVINARIALAKELLRGTTLTVSEVAERAGYGDACQFSRQFRQRTAKTPSAYRAECGDRASPVGRG